MAKVMTIPSALTTPSELDYRRILVIGPSGIGKTTFCGSAHLDPRCSPMCILDFDKGASSLKGLIGPHGDEISVYPINTYSDLDIIYEYLASGQSPYKSILVDSISESQILSLFDIADERIERDGDKGKNKSKFGLEELDFGRSLNQMRRLIRSLRALPMHIFFTSLVKAATLPREGLVRTANMMGTMGEEIVASVDCCWQLVNIEKTDKQGNKTNIRELILQNFPGIRAKTRTGWGITIPDEIVLNKGSVYPIITDLFDMLHIKNPTLDSE